MTRHIGFPFNHEAVHQIGPMARLVIFDLDRTIVRFGTYTPFLMAWARQQAPWRFVFAPLILLSMLAYKLKFFSRARLKEIMFALMVGRPSERAMYRAAHDFADHILEGACFPDALAAIRAHKNAGDILMLATASFAFYAEAIAARLGIPHVVATGLGRRNGRFVPKLVGENCYGEAKRRMVLAALPGLANADAGFLFYTDDRSDLPLLRAAKAGIVVNPKAGLAAWARTRDNMTVVRWQAERKAHGESCHRRNPRLS